jgi:gluconolactonase
MNAGPAIAFETNARYPDPRVEVLDERFLKLRLFSASVEQLATGMRWAEGPVWFGDHQCLLFNDLPNNRTLRWSERHGVSVFRETSDYGNGQTRDHQGRLITCHHRSRCLTRGEHDGSTTTLVGQADGKALNAPNDVVVKSDGSIWFSDPLYGLIK